MQARQFGTDNKMAKITNPLHSLNATGAFGKKITFTGSTGGQRAIMYRAPKGTSTPAKTTNYAAGCAAWQLLDSAAKAAWKAIATQKKLTGFNAFMSD
jgi:hypothetical protein